MRKYILLALLLVVFLFVGVMTRGAVLAGPTDQDSPPAGAKGEEATDTAEVDIVPVGSMAQEVVDVTVNNLEATQLILGQSLVGEIEPNNTITDANTLSSNNTAVLGNIYPNADVDYFSFTAVAGDRVYAAVMTSFGASGSTDSALDVLDAAGVSLEFDNDDGSLGGLSSSIAGVTIPSSGTYYVRVRHFSATGQLRPYHLHFQLQSGTPTAETEPNDAGQPLPPSGWVSGQISATTDVDIYTLSLNAGDTVYLSLDLDPERDAVEWNGWVGLGAFNGFFLVVNDGGTSTPDSEAFFLTVKDAGVYNILVSVPTGGTTFGTYHLSASVIPAETPSGSCTTYTNSTPTVLTDAGLTTSTIVVPGNPRIADLDVSIDMAHTDMTDMDLILQAPDGNSGGLFTDIGSNTQQVMNLVLDDEAAIPFAFTVVSGMRYQPELNYRLDWFDYQDAGGTWTLNLYDDAATDTGTLNSWSITICEPPPLPACPTGTAPTVLYSNDFETTDGGFTHSGTQDEWEWGSPTAIPITTCRSGANCWKTDLDSTYNASSNQDLLSPGVVISGTGIVGPVYLSWAQKYQMESASFDHAYVDVRQVGGSSPTRLFEWLAATMTTAAGTPSVTIQESSGWSVYTQDITGYLGQNVEVLFHVDTDSSVQLGGLAIDDVSIIACGPPPQAAITLEKTVGTDPSTCAATSTISLPFFGDDVTYCYTVTNIGNVALTLHDLVDDQLGTILDDFPFTLAAGASTFITQTATVTETTVNNATWTATDGVTTTVQASDTAVVNVAVPQPSINVNKTVGTDPAVCATSDSVTLPFGGGDVTYCFEIENTGNITLTNHNLTDSELGAILTNFSYTLAPGASAFITETANIVLTTVNTATWTADLPSAPVLVTATDSDTATVIVESAAPEMVVSPDSMTSSQPADAVMTQTLTISNPGDAALDWTIQEGALYGGVLYDNGPLVNSPGTGSGGADESMLQNTTLAMTVIGFGHQIVNNNSMADDFTIPASQQWTIDDITFFAYQTGSTTTSTITGMNVDIYDGDPSAGGTIIASSTTMLSTQWSGIYRVTQTTSGNTTRPVMATVMDMGGLTLGEGTYWIEWQASGSLASGPWAPAVTINGQTATGNGLQNLAGTWQAAMDVGQQGLPFVISGTSGCSGDVPWLSVSPTAGTTPQQESSDVTVTFDSTGLTPGTYNGNLCVAGNAPANPLVTVPVTLTVEGAPVITVAPASLESIQLPDTAVTQQMTISNTGDVDLTWDIYEDDGAGFVFGNSWADNFDSYATGSQLHGQGGWKGWDNSPAAGALTSSAQARSTPNSADISGAADLVHEYSGFTSGQYTYTAWQYIPSSYTGQAYFILLNTYADGGTKNWSTQVCFNSTTDMLYDDAAASCASGNSLPIIYDQWVEIRVEIDLDADSQTFYYDDQMLFQDTWTGHVSGNGAVNIAAVDLFANNSTPVYYDDMSLAAPVLPPCAVAADIPWASVSPDTGTTGVGASSTVDVTFDSTGLATGVYTGTLCVESNDPVTPLVEVPLMLTVEEITYGVAVTAVDNALSGAPGTTVNYTVWVTNTGNVADTYDLSVSGNTWPTTPSAASVTLDPGEGTSVTVDVDIPATAGDGDTDTATVTATSTGDGSVSGSTDLTTTAVTGATYGVSLSPDDAASGAPGSDITYTVWITNEGNVADTFDLSLSGNTWTAVLSASSITLDAGASGSVTVVVSIPSGAAEGDDDSVTVTAVSQNDATATDSATLTTTAQMPTYVIYLPIILKDN